MSPRVSALTVRGRVVLGSAAAMAMAAWLFGVQELYCLALAAVVVTAGARVWVDTRRWDLQVSRFVHPNRVPAGQEARVELAVRDATGRTTPPVEARDPFDGGRRWARFHIAPLHPGEVRTSSYRLPSTRRGVYRLGPLELRLYDPFGLAASTRTTALETTLTVHPAFEMVVVAGVSAHRDEDRRLHQPVIGKGGSEFYALREYVAGDDLRHVHWPTTARLDDLVIRQPENLRRGRLTVMADLRSSVQDEETLEAVLSAVASLAMSAIRTGMQVRVVTTAGWDSGHGTGRGHGPFLLDGLAAAVVHKPQAGVAPFRMAGGLEPVVIVTTDRCAQTDLQSAFGLSGTSGTTVVVFEGRRPGAGSAGPSGAGSAGPSGAGSPGSPGTTPGGLRSGGRTVMVRRGGSFAAAWTLHTRSDRRGAGAGRP